MSLKILLADDNITAQKMGAKILSDAGYEVVPVSNGAAAVKKIASEKPAIVILDVYMPGYTGLEVCEKLKNARETARVPVLLTITRMEPFNPEDANRVKADGVLVKPFEATDLLAVVRKFEEKVQAAPAVAESSATPAAEESSEHEVEWDSGAVRSQAADMPAEIASAPALGLEDLSPAHTAQEKSAATPAVAAPTEHAPFAVEGPGPGFESHSASAEKPAIAPPPDLEFTSAPQAATASAAPAPELEATAQERAADAVIVRDPALATDPNDFAEFVTKFGTQSTEDETTEIAAEAPLPESLDDAIEITIDDPASSPIEPQADVAPLGFSTADLMEKTSVIEPQADADAASAAAAVEQPAGEDTVFVMREMVAEAMAIETGSESRPVSAISSAAAAAPVAAREAEPEFGMETRPIDIFPGTHVSKSTGAPATPSQDVAAIARDMMAGFAAELQVAQQAAPKQEKAATTPAATANDDQRIAQAVDRVLDRYKGELIAAIVQELER